MLSFIGNILYRIYGYICWWYYYYNALLAKPTYTKRSEQKNTASKMIRREDFFCVNYPYMKYLAFSKVNPVIRYELTNRALRDRKFLFTLTGSELHNLLTVSANNGHRYSRKSLQIIRDIRANISNYLQTKI
jgi:hypothetical protein